VADRLQAWRNAFTANHDDMARLLWFQYEASLQSNGWGVGQTPWCGGVKFDRCHGLPLQLQSDYTFTALVGWWGPVGAWLTVIFFSGYVYLWLMHAARFSAIELQPVNIISAGGLKIALLTQLLFLSGLVMLVQMSITVSGNLGWLPLTGITWPLISYGKTSLWVTTFLIGTASRRSNHA
jgi:cell division protein FtsW (lipid II flippase)